MRALVRRAIAVTACAGLTGAALPRARADTPSIDPRTFRPSTDPSGSLTLEPTMIAPPGAFGVANYFSYAYRPLRVERADTGEEVARPLEHVVGGDFVLHLPSKYFAIGLDVPYIIAQTGDKNLDPAIATGGRAPLTAIGDIALEAKLPLVTYETAGGAFGLKGRVTAPTGDSSSFAGAGSWRAELHALAEYSLLIVSAHASVGYLTRTSHVRWPDRGGTVIGDELPWSAGFRFRPKILGVDEGDRQTWELAVRGSIPAGPVGPFGGGDPGSARLSPVLLGLSDRIALGETHDFFVIGGVDVGVSSALGVPPFRAIAGLGWTPREHDQDHDGVRDDKDQCPEIPEDRDGFEDDDGCPDIDNDDDGVLDKDDACPREAGVEQPAPRNGCPAPDQDKDGVADDVDACPTRPGASDPDPRISGCPRDDRDGDGVPDAIDRCPDEPEDKDKFQDEDGCPDLDDDADGIPDTKDACPREAGEPSADLTRHGCPRHDRDGDGLEDAADQCPDVPEVYNGVSDDDGCADKGGALLVNVRPQDDAKKIKAAFTLARPIKLEPDSGGAPVPTEPTRVLLRAIALELSRHRDYTLTVGARPTKDDDGSKRALVIVQALRDLTGRPGVAEVVGWDAVKNESRATESGFGIGVVVAPEAPTATPKPKTSTSTSTSASTSTSTSTSNVKPKPVVPKAPPPPPVPPPVPEPAPAAPVRDTE